GWVSAVDRFARGMLRVFLRRNARCIRRLYGSKGCLLERRAGARAHHRKARWPWQDRWMLFGFANCLRTAASRRLAHGFRAGPKTMRENRYVRDTQSAT